MRSREHYWSERSEASEQARGFEDLDDGDLDAVAGGQLYLQAQAVGPGGAGIQFNTSTGLQPVQTVGPFFDFNPTDPSQYNVSIQSPSPLGFSPIASVDQPGPGRSEESSRRPEEASRSA